MDHSEASVHLFRRACVALTGVLIAVLSLAACGSSTPAKTTIAATGGTGGGGSSASSSAGLAEATAAVAKYSALPTRLTVATPLPQAPPKGKTVVFLQCEVPQCTDGGNGFRAAAAAIGWQTKTLSWQTTEPASLVSAMQEALTLTPKPYAVSISGLPEAIWGSEVAAYAKAGVLLMPWSIGPVTYSKTLFAEVLSPQDISLQGKLLADWFIVNSKGTGKVLLQNVPQYPSIDEEATGFGDEVTAACPSCSLTTLNVTGSQVASNAVTSTIVSSLQRNPSIGYVASADIALAPGLAEAIAAAGLKVKILGGAASSVDELSVRDGGDAAVMENDLVYCGWLMIDALARHAEGLPVTRNDGGVVQEILTQSNVNAVGASDQVPAGYPHLFEKLWRV